MDMNAFAKSVRGLKRIIDDCDHEIERVQS